MRPGEEWGGPPAPGTPVREVAGDDATLAAAATPEVVLRIAPGTGADLARALGLPATGPGTTVVACDLIDVTTPGSPARPAANVVVSGRAPDALRPWHRRRPVTVTVDGRPVHTGPATGVVIANGQFLRGADLVPRGHPGDGRLEVQVYGLRPGERGPMRRRLPTGDHVPHPRIVGATGRRVEVRWTRPVPVEADGHPGDPATVLVAAVRPGALRVLV